MASKHKTRHNIIDKSNYESDDSDVVTFKRKRINVFDNSDTNESHHDTNTHNTSHISKYIRITEDEYYEQDNSFKFVEKSGPQYLLPHSSDGTD